MKTPASHVPALKKRPHAQVKSISAQEVHEKSDRFAEQLAAILLAQIEEKYKRKKFSSVDRRKRTEETPIE